MAHYEIPLFPLSVVVFPLGVLPLRIFEARYLDMVRDCLRNKTPFAVVTTGTDNNADPLPFASIGTVCNIAEVDATEPGLMNIRCIGAKKMRVMSAAQQKNGLWIGQVEDYQPEPNMAIPEDLNLTQQYMQQLIESLASQNIEAFSMPLQEPYQLDDCGWIANRWTEILNIPLIEKQRMLALDSPLVRLELVQDYLTQSFGVTH